MYRILDLRIKGFYIIIFFLTAYFLLHGLYGDRGLFSYFEVKQKMEASIQELQIVHAERIKLEKKVNLLSPESLDADILEEEAKKNFDLGKRKEKILR